MRNKHAFQHANPDNIRLGPVCQAIKEWSQMKWSVSSVWPVIVRRRRLVAVRRRVGRGRPVTVSGPRRVRGIGPRRRGPAGSARQRRGRGRGGGGRAHHGRSSGRRGRPRGKLRQRGAHGALDVPREAGAPLLRTDRLLLPDEPAARARDGGRLGGRGDRRRGDARRLRDRGRGGARRDSRSWGRARRRARHAGVRWSGRGDRWRRRPGVRRRVGRRRPRRVRCLGRGHGRVRVPIV